MKGGDIFVVSAFCKIFKVIFFVALLAFIILVIQHYTLEQQDDTRRYFTFLVLPLTIATSFFVGFSSISGICRIYEEIPYLEDKFMPWFERHNKSLKYSDGLLEDIGGKRYSIKRS
jgi:hypothetical protein